MSNVFQFSFMKKSPPHEIGCVTKSQILWSFVCFACKKPITMLVIDDSYVGYYFEWKFTLFLAGEMSDDWWQSVDAMREETVLIAMSVAWISNFLRLDNVTKVWEITRIFYWMLMVKLRHLMWYSGENSEILTSSNEIELVLFEIWRLQGQNLIFDITKSSVWIEWI